MSKVVAGWSMSDRALFALYASLLIGGPLFIIPFPVVYWRPEWFISAVVDDADADGRQAALDEFATSEKH